MAKLAKDPMGWELEDFISAHFVSRVCYVEKSVKERNPDEILELDIVWTDYRNEPQARHPVEVKQQPFCGSRENHISGRYEDGYEHSPVGSLGHAP